MNQLKSEKVVIEAPFSFAGSKKRIWKITRWDNRLKPLQLKKGDNDGFNLLVGWFNLSSRFVTTMLNAMIKMSLYGIALGLIMTAWMGVVVWYFMFGILLIPYRLIRRGQRKQKRDILRHRELLDALDKRQ